MLDTLYLPCGIVLSACAADRPLIWSKPGAAEQSFNIDKFDYLKQAQENKVVIVGGVAESGTVTNYNLYNAACRQRVGVRSRNLAIQCRPL